MTRAKLESTASPICITLIALALALWFILPAAAQNTPGPGPYITPQGVVFPLQAPPAVVSGASVTHIGNPGARTLYYWIISHTTIGASVPAGPFTLRQAASVFQSGSAVQSGTYTSGITATGSAGQTCTLGSFNHSSTATATVALTGHNAIAPGTALVFTSLGTGATAAPTTAAAGNGTATCSGTATVATTLGTNYTAGGKLTWNATAPGVTYDVLRTATPDAPSGVCNCRVATGLSTTTASDTSEALSAYIVNPVNASFLQILLQNIATGLGTNCLAANSICIGGYTPPTAACSAGDYANGLAAGLSTCGQVQYSELGGTVPDAPALAATPTQCLSGQFATGIAANGNANCTTPPAGVDQYAAGDGCMIAPGSYRCTATVTWTTAFADTNYLPVCTAAGPCDGTNTNAICTRTYGGGINIAAWSILSFTAAAVTMQISNVGNESAIDGQGYTTIYCYGHPGPPSS